MKTPIRFLAFCARPSGLVHRRKTGHRPVLPKTPANRPRPSSAGTGRCPVLLFLVVSLTLNVALAEDPDADTSVAGNDQVAEIIKTYGGRGTLADDTPPTPAEEAVKQFKVREGFEIELMASEPAVTQPLFATWDSRGRMWVVQYRQYQFPAGLKILRYDQHLRAVFDKVPEPPPHGPRGADVITVFEDTDGDGFFDTHKDVITGLNIATSVQVGRGGIWVLQPPYLLFYPDADGDDVPDADPEVHLSGFGLEDTHAVANSLTWGPDGWLYGANGSTTTGNVSSAVTKNVQWQGQCIWRYHPETKVFEIFAEGGGNTFSLEIDAKGHIFSGTNNGSTRGMYYPQGSYGKKGWGKHGPLTNPYAFGFFEHMRHEGDNRRFAQAFCIYEGGLYPEEFDGAIVAPNSLHNVVWLSKRIRDTSTYRTVDEEPLVQTEDRWFRPVWCGGGPDGCVYIADWYDTRLSHVRPVDDWHKSSGRIYRVKPVEDPGMKSPADFTKAGVGDLTGWSLFSTNPWAQRRAVLELGWRNEENDQIVELLESFVMVERKEWYGLSERILGGTIGEDGAPQDVLNEFADQTALGAIWALNALNERNAFAEFLSKTESPDVRRWIVRIMGDRRETLPGFVDLARTEPDVQVRAQLASTAKRLPSEAALPIIEQLLRRSEDLEDLHMPLMIWWALEAHAETGREGVIAMLSNPEVWSLPMLRQHIAARLMQRYAMAGGEENLATAAKLLELAPDEEVRAELLVGLNRAFQGLPMPKLPDALSEALAEYEASQGSSPLVLKLRQGDASAIPDAVKAATSSATNLVERIELAKALGDTGNPAALAALLKLIPNDSEHALQRVAMRAAAKFDDERVAKTILGRYNSSISNEHDVRGTANRVLASRASWAKAFLDQIDTWHIRANEIQPDVVQQLRIFDEPEIAALVEKHFGRAGTVSSPEKLAEMARIKTALAGKTGSAESGRVIYTQRCAVCHKLFDEGGAIGPELTGYERGNLEFWLPGILDPSLEIREGYETYVARLKDGRVLTGMMAAQEPQTITLRDLANQTSIVSRADIASLQAIPISLMPEGLLGGLSEAQLADLFAYLSLTAQ